MKTTHANRGVTLIETMIAVLIAMVAIFGLGNLVFQATAVNKNQGSETTRAVIYAQDKMEKLLSLAAYSPSGVPISPSSSATTPTFVDCTQPVSTPQPTVCNTTNINDPGWGAGLLAGGGVAVPVVVSGAITMPVVVYACGSISSSQQGYIDYLDINGIQLPQSGTPPVATPGSCNSAFANAADMPAYIRQWQITDLTTPGTGPTCKQIVVAVYSLTAVAANGGKPIVILTSYVESPN